MTKYLLLLTLIVSCTTPAAKYQRRPPDTLFFGGMYADEFNQWRLGYMRAFTYDTTSFVAKDSTTMKISLHRDTIFQVIFLDTTGERPVARWSNIVRPRVWDYMRPVPFLADTVLKDVK